jgi:hypothetical protein
MMRLFFVFAAFQFLSVYAVIAASEERKSPWADIALTDIDAIYRLIKDNHPGPVDEQNPAYRKSMESNYQKARNLAKDVKNYNGYYFAVKYFANSFNDGHISLIDSVVKKRNFWPKFAVVLVGKDFLVQHAEASSGEKYPQVGDRVLTCDGRSPHDMLQEDIKKYYGVDGLVAEDVMDSAHLFIDYGNPFVERPKECRFSRDGETFSATLDWKSISSEKIETIRKQLTGLNRPDYAVTEFSENAYWIRLPSFQTSNENTTKLKGIIKTIGEMAETLQKADAIVFDMRGNTGGNSSWGDQALKTLWGSEILDHAGRGWSYIDWRVSEENIRANNYYADLYLGVEGEEGGRVKYYRGLAAALQKERDAGNTFYRITNRASTRDKMPEPPVAKIFLLTNFTCFSACLDFADSVRSIPGATHIGSPTRADAIYIDNWAVPLPSGLARLSYSMKVYRGRIRGHNEPYIPHIAYEGADWSTPALQLWVSSLVHE